MPEKKAILLMGRYSLAFVGGFDLAAEWMGWENIFQVENNKFCTEKLTKNFPNTERYGDIKEFDGTKYRGLIDILTGGFPCQPFSVAGKQKGESDDRYLWPQMLRVIREIQPSWIIGENVPGIIKLALEDICSSLEGEGYEVQPFIIPSASIGAWDKRDRVWIIAHNNQFRCYNEQKESGETLQDKIRITEAEKQSRGEFKCGIMQSNSVNPDIESTISEQSGETRSGGNGRSNSIGDIISKGLQRYSGNDLSGRDKEQERQAGQANWSRSWIEVASELCRSDARISHRMDRIKALGSSVNPYVSYQIFKTIELTQKL